ncbi:MAG TPA: glycosyltransferase family 87 protein [Candidatus Acidoferrales bacterium]|nr:glycosyltransferase family 87 protein [Candidatus Acidoferrales bacterium]
MNDDNSPAANAEGYLTAAILIWVVTLGFICAGLISGFSHRSVTPDYHAAVQRWIAGQLLYGGYHYFPQFVFLFFPFHALPAPWGDVLWRLLSTGLLVWGLWRLISLVDSPRTKQLFFYATLIVLIPSFDALRNGQANVIFAAFTIHAAVSLAQSKWGAATAWLLLALIAKPLGLVMILLAVLVYRILIWRLAIGIALFLVFPFVLGRGGYVLAQYHESMRHLLDLSIITENRFADLNGLLRKLGIGLTGRASQAVRAAAGLVTALAWWLGARRLRQPEQACFLLALATTYLMLFNPMTEENSYVIVLPVLAYYSLRLLLVEGRRLVAWGLILGGISMGLLPELLRRMIPDFGLWWRPIIMLVFSGVLMGLIASREVEVAGVGALPSEQNSSVGSRGGG